MSRSPFREESNLSSLSLPVWWCLAWCCLLGFGSFPLYPCDDLYFLGCSDELSRTGRLWSEHGAGSLRFLGLNQFLTYPPFAFYLHASWNFFFGTSAFSLSVFTGLQALGITALLSVVFREFQLGSVAIVIALPGLFPALFYGVRPDGCAYILAFLCGVCFREPRPILGFGAGFLLVASFGAYPTAVVLAGALGTGLFLRNRSRWPLARWIPWTGACLLGVSVCALVLTIALNGDVKGLFQTMNRFREGKWGGPFSPFVQTWLMLKSGREWYLSLPWVLFGIAIAARGAADAIQRRDSVCARLLPFIGGALAITYIYPLVGLRWLNVMSILAAAGFVLSRVTGSCRRWVFVGLAAAATLSNLRYHLGVLGTERASEAACAEFRAELGRHKIVRIDAAVARYVFDYRLPTNVVALPFNWQRSASDKTGFPPHVSNRPREEFWCLSQSSLSHMVSVDGMQGAESTLVHMNPLRLLGRSFSSVPSQHLLIAFDDRTPQGRVLGK